MQMFWLFALTVRIIEIINEEPKQASESMKYEEPKRVSESMKYEEVLIMKPTNTKIKTTNHHHHGGHCAGMHGHPHLGMNLHPTVQTLPTPEELAKYEELVPGSAKKLVAGFLENKKAARKESRKRRQAHVAVALISIAATTVVVASTVLAVQDVATKLIDYKSN